MKKVAIFGPPRSGTTWLSLMFGSHPNVALRYQPLFSYTHKGALTSGSNSDEIEAFFSAILQTKDKFVLMESEEQKIHPKFTKSDLLTHIVFKETRYLNVIRNILNSSSDVVVVGIIRNPLSTLASWIEAPREFDRIWDIHAEWRKAPSKNQGKAEEYFGFEKWKQAANEFIEMELLYPEKFRLIRYRQLLENTELEVQNLFEFCSLPMHINTRKFVQESRTRHDEDPYSVFRVKVAEDEWRTILPESIQNAVQAELKDSPASCFLDG